ncbi:MAG: DUF1080 domain-containing protein, partial [Anaerolineales bacterium]|nr:DUF1080 domain-containing protein [Anaerolineales bacterium]
DVTNATSYRLQEDDNASFSSPVIRYSGVYTSYNVTGQAGGTWYYRVRAFNGGGNSDWSNPRHAAVDPPPYAPPILNPISNEDGDGSFIVKWTSVVSATGYILEQSADEYFAEPSKVFEGSTLEKAFSDVTGRTWYYRVRAKGPEGKSAWSNSQSVLVISNVYFPIMVNNYSSATGFDSQFNGSIDGWNVTSGTWIVGANYLSTSGIDGQWVSISYPQTFYNLDYQVKMKRSGCDLCATIVLVRGNPDILVEKNHWYSYYAFQYHMKGRYSVYKRVGGVSYWLKEWTDNPAINTGDAWNTIRILADGVNLYYYINGSLVWSGVDTSLQSGKVGIAMYQEPDDENLLQVDWATLTSDVSQSGDFIGEELLGESVEAIPAQEGSEDMDIN